jgi:hypothetical protein
MPLLPLPLIPLMPLMSPPLSFCRRASSIEL